MLFHRRVLQNGECYPQMYVLSQSSLSEFSMRVKVHQQFCTFYRFWSYFSIKTIFEKQGKKATQTDFEKVYTQRMIAEWRLSHDVTPPTMSRFVDAGFLILIGKFQDRAPAVRVIVSISARVYHHSKGSAGNVRFERATNGTERTTRITAKWKKLKVPSALFNQNESCETVVCLLG